MCVNSTTAPAKSVPAFACMACSINVMWALLCLLPDFRALLLLQTHHPGWQEVIWDEASVLDLMQQDFPWFLPTYLSYPRLVQRSDVMRYMVLYKYGGVYLDADVSACWELTDEASRQAVDRTHFLLQGHKCMIPMPLWVCRVCCLHSGQVADTSVLNCKHSVAVSVRLTGHLAD